MLQSILSFFTSSSSSTGLSSWIKGLILVVAVVGAAVLGYTLAAKSYAAEISRLQAEYSAKAQAMAESNLEEAKKSAKRLSDAITARDAALRELDAARGDSDGLRDELASYQRKLSATGTGACESERKRLAGCVRLLREGADLASEGARLAQRIAIDKDAIAALK